MKAISIIGVVVIISIACFFLFRGCEQSKSVQAIKDSLNVERALNDTIKIEKAVISKANDSVMAKSHKDSTIFISKIDSLTKIVATLKGQFRVTKDSIGTLYGQLKTFYYQHDTVALVETYNRLSSELTEANNQLFAIQLARDSSDNARDTEIVRLNGLIKTLEAQISELQALLVSCTANASNLAKTGDLAIKKAKASGLFAKIGMGIAALIAVLLLIK
jgi:hypothetical protein